MVSGFLLSAFVICKYKPGPRKLFFWNVIVGIGYMVGQVVYIFLSCDNNYINNFTGTLNLTAPCNTNCSCTGVAYSPVCYEATSTTFFSPCHAGCNRWDDDGKFYDNCACSTESRFTKMPVTFSTASLNPEVLKSSLYSTEFGSSGIPSTTQPVISTTNVVAVSIGNTGRLEIIENVTSEDQHEPILFKSIINTTDNLSSDAHTGEVSYAKADDTVPIEIDRQNDFNAADEEVKAQQSS